MHGPSLSVYPEYITPPLCIQGIPACGVYRHQLQCGSSGGGMESPRWIPYGRVYVVNHYHRRSNMIIIGGR